MSRTYLPADVRTRIIDLMKEHKFSQKKLALSIGVHESTLGRFLNGTTEKLSEESVIRIAKTSMCLRILSWERRRSQTKRIMILLNWACPWKLPKTFIPERSKLM